MKKTIVIILLAVLLITGCQATEKQTEVVPTAPTATDYAPPATTEPNKGQISNDDPSANTDNLKVDVDVTDFSVYNAPAVTVEDYPTVDGSTADVPLILALMRAATGCDAATAEENTLISTTDYSYTALKDGRADLLIVYEPSKPTADGLDVFNYFDIEPIGLDALVFIVNTDNPVNNLTRQQVVDIYQGKITNWSEVGGNDEPISAFQRPTLSGSQTLMLKLMMKDEAMIEPQTELISESMADVIEDVSAYDNGSGALGYSVYYYAENMYAQSNLKFLSIDGVMPSTQSIRSGEYGYCNPFYAVVRKDETGAARTLYNWLITTDGQRLINDCGYVPLGN